MCVGGGGGHADGPPEGACRAAARPRGGLRPVGPHACARGGRLPWEQMEVAEATGMTETAAGVCEGRATRLTFRRDPVLVRAPGQAAVMRVQPGHVAGPVAARGRTLALFLFCSRGI